MKKLLVACCGLILALQGVVAHAAEPSLQLQPLQYVETLQKGERKRGFIDITNTQSEAIDVALSVEGFRQIDDKGNLEFFDDERLRNGIQLDLKDAQIPPRKTLRLFFVADSTKLPAGDVFAAIFAKTVSAKASGADMSVRLGSLLMITNGSPGARQAKIESLSAPWVQLGTTLAGEVTIKNTASSTSASGFFPRIQLTLWPVGGTKTISSPLVYAGNTRTVKFSFPSNQVGIVRLRASYQDSSQERWIVVVTGYWRWVMAVLVGAGIGAAAWLILRYIKRHSMQK